MKIIKNIDWKWLLMCGVILIPMAFVYSLSYGIKSSIIYYFIMWGALLLVAIIYAIDLTINKNKIYKKYKN